MRDRDAGVEVVAPTNDDDDDGRAASGRLAEHGVSQAWH